jgi:hypothetical protein
MSQIGTKTKPCFEPMPYTFEEVKERLNDLIDGSLHKTIDYILSFDGTFSHAELWDIYEQYCE